MAWGRRDGNPWSLGFSPDPNDPMVNISPLLTFVVILKENSR